MRNLIGSDGSGRMADDFIPPSLDRYWVEASASATLVPIPVTAKYVLFSFPDGNYGVAYGDSNIVAEIPSASGAPTNLDEWCPSQRKLNGQATHLSIIARTSHDGMVSFYS